MAFRRRLHKRVYVEDELPRFLQEGRHQADNMTSQTAADSGSTQLATIPRQSSWTTLGQMLFSRSQTDSSFVFKAVTVTLVLNIMLYFFLSVQPPISTERLSLKTIQPSEELTAYKLEDRVLTFSTLPSNNADSLGFENLGALAPAAGPTSE